MSFVLCSSPLSSSGKTIHLNNENKYSSVSSPLLDYNLLNSIIKSNQFEKTLELYSLMSNNCLNNQEKISLENFLDELINEYGQIASNELKELFEIFENATIRSLICSYDSILQYYSTMKCHLSDDDSSLKIDQNSIKDEKAKNNDERENCFYASKLTEYNVTRLKIVRLEKRRGEPLGVTICRLSDDDYRISIGRIIHGSVAQGLFSVGDQLLEINNINIQTQYQTLDQVVQLIDSLHGTISFLLLPKSNERNSTLNNQSFYSSSYNQKQKSFDYSSMYVRCLFSYDPHNDLYIPCRELGVQLKKGTILQIVNREDPYWWQAFLLRQDEYSTDQQFPSLVPSKQFQEKRLKIVKSLLDDEINRPSSKKRLKDKFFKTINQQSKQENIIFTTLSLNIYEPVQWYIPNNNRKRPIILIGPPYIGRHELRERLINSVDLSLLIDVAVPHTTRLKKDDEIDGRDYHFITREQFERDILNDLFVEHGEYEKNLYGTSKSAIETSCLILNKICILNLLGEALQSFKYCNLLPYIIYLKVPSTIEQLREYFYVNEQQWNEIQQKSSSIEENYSHLFDKTIHLTDSFHCIFSQLKFLVKDVQNKPMWVNQCWFSPVERF